MRRTARISLITLLALSILVTLVIDGLCFIEGHIYFATTRYPDTHSSFDVDCWIQGEAMKGVRRVILVTPRHKSFSLSKTGDDQFEFGEYNSAQWLQSNFPGGDYTLRFNGRSAGKITFYHSAPSFPPYPTILSPQDDEQGVSLTPIISWEEIPECTYGIFIWKGHEGEETIYYNNIGSEPMFTIPEGLFESNTWYQVEITANSPNHSGNACYRVRFATGP